MNFLDSFYKEVQKIEGISTSAEPPRYWYSTGNAVLNKIISDSFYRGIPQGRITTLAGPSSAGKSFLLCNVMREAQKAGAIILVLDSENALDNEFVEKIGVDTSSNYMYVGIRTINQMTEVISSFLKRYRTEQGTGLDAPQVLIAIDSLDMLITETEEEHFMKGVQKGDQGQKNKQLKHALRTYVQAIKDVNITIVATTQVYKNQDLLNGEGLWIISDAVKYSASQIVLLTKMKLKDTGSSEVKGIRMKCQGYKTRFTKPYQEVVIEVPYEQGMDPYSGLLEVSLSLGLIEKKGSRYCIAGQDTTWFSKDLAQHAEKLILQAESQKTDLKVEDVEGMEEDTETETKKQTRARVRAKMKDSND